MRPRRSLLAVLIALGVLLLAPALVRADAGSAIVHQCLNSGRITGHFSQQAYSEALAELPADVTEYSDCPSLIRQAQLAAAAHTGGGSSGGTGIGGGPASGAGSPGGASAGAPLSPHEKAALTAAAHPRGAAAGVQVGSELVRPGLVHANIAAAVRALPTPLLVLIAVLGAAALFVGARLGYQRVGSRRGL
jgi:hypothetical protein